MFGLNVVVSNVIELIATGSGHNKSENIMQSWQSPVSSNKFPKQQHSSTQSRLQVLLK